MSLFLLFLKTHWKTIGVALVIGGLIAAFGFLYGAWQMEKGQAAKYKAERDVYKTAITRCVDTNQRWELTAETWNQAMADLQNESEGFKTRLADERERRRATETKLADLEAQVTDQITATDCEGALDQLVTALGWGGSP
jgi:chromosome segregation ATPase